MPLTADDCFSRAASLRNATLAAALLPILAMACGSSSTAASGPPIDCAWLASDNCWKTTAAGADSCLPASGAMGKLSADLTTCTYTTGQVITFDSPLTLPLPNQPNFNFTITSGGATCFRFQQSSQQGFSLTTHVGTASVAASGAGETIHCPDGSSYSASVSQALSDLSCDAGPLGGLPGTANSSSTGSVSFSLLGTTGGDTPVLSCSM